MSRRPGAPVPLPPAHATLAARVITGPDPSRYGPKVANSVGEPAEVIEPFRYAREGRTAGMPEGELGCSATCRCGWVMWTPNRSTTEAKATAPKAKGGHECKYVKKARGDDDE